MISSQYRGMLQGKSVIRVLSERATKRGAEIGYENVFDYSLGNPSVPAPADFTRVMTELLQKEDPMKLHGYSPTLGIPSVKEKIAASLTRRFGLPYRAEHIFPTAGAAGAIAHALRLVTSPGDEVLTFAPFFPEYHPYVDLTGAVLKVVPPDTESFQIRFDALEEYLTPKVAALLINTPNNPSGAVYSAETLKKLAEILTRKSKEFGHRIFLISDEPYREIVYHDKVGTQSVPFSPNARRSVSPACAGTTEAPYVADFYDDVITCYSFSKSLSLPGERIGYVAVSPRCEEAALLVQMCGQISRGIGHNCPSSIIQLAVAEVVDLTSDLSVYEKNMNLLYDHLTNLGFEVVKPGGTFYIFPKALEEDANAFCQKALDYDLVLVPGDSFGCPGYFRMAYCIGTEKVERSLDAFTRFVKGTY